MKEATYVAISTQKGGAGKTTLTVLVASYLHYVKGYNVAVVDCDFPQYSIHDMRKRDMKAVMEDGYYKVLAYEQLKRLKKNPYPIRCSRAEDAIRTAENLVEAQPDLDFVFFDLPGTINNADVVQTISKMDYIFTPIIADRVVMESSIKFATVINEQMISTGKSGIKGIYLVWNMVDGREKTELYKAYDKVCAEFALPILETYLPDSKRFRKDKGRDKPLSTFLQTSEIKTRQCIYISREIHEKVAIVASRMGNGLSIGKFVDNILRDHFRQYGQQYMEQIENAQKVRL
jgi:cellulose biosynthesis protein BcsQ